MGVFNIYVDESGKLSGKSEYTSLCGYLGHAQEWNRFGVEWTACRLRWGVPPIHMARIMDPDRKDDGWTLIKQKWGVVWESRRDRMLEELSIIIMRASLACVGTVVDATAYRKIQTESDCDLHYTDSNVFAFHNIIMNGLEKIEAVDKFSPVSIVVDDDPENAFDYYGMLNTLRTHDSDQFQKVKDRVHGISFCDDASYPGLQAADMISYVARRCKLEKDPNFDITPCSLYPNLTFGGVHQPRVYTEEVLYEVARGTAKAIKERDHEAETE